MDPRIYNLDNSASGCWYVIHFLAANGERKALKILLKNFEKRFMCPKCRMHIKNHLENNPIPAEGVDPWVLFLWTTNFHNAVNMRLKKPLFSEIGEIELFKQLTTGADEDGEEYMSKLMNSTEVDAENVDCEGCTSKSKKIEELNSTAVSRTEDVTDQRKENDFLLKRLSRQEWPISSVRFI